MYQPRPTSQWTRPQRAPKVSWDLHSLIQYEKKTTKFTGKYTGKFVGEVGAEGVLAVGRIRIRYRIVVLELGCHKYLI